MKSNVKIIFKMLLLPVGLLLFMPTILVRAEEPQKTLLLSSSDAVETALKNNKSLQIQKLTPVITSLNRKIAESAFDPTLSAGLSSSMSGLSTDSKSHRNTGSVDIAKTLKSGGQITLGLTSDDSSQRSYGNLYSTNLLVSFKQPLLNGAGKKINTIAITQSDMDAKIARYELQGYTEALIDQVISTYWDFALAQKKLSIYEDSLKLAERQLSETEEMVKVGKLAEVELVPAQAEVATRRQALINITGQCDTLKLKLLQLTNPSGGTDFWDTSIVINDNFIAPNVKMDDLRTQLSIALTKRADLETARLQKERGLLDVVKTKNGLLPYLSFFVDLGNTAYSDNFSNTYGNILNGEHDVQFGLNYSHALGNNSAQAKYEQTLLKQEQANIALENMSISVESEVRTNYIEMSRSHNQIDAAEASRKVQEEKLRTESEKYYIGKSTSINVAVAQRDLLQSQVDEVQAIADYIKSITSLYKSEGVILEKYGITLAE